MRLKQDFYRQDAITVARKLIGKLLVRNIMGKKMVCRIVETEAYLGPEDKGCHAYQNKRTKRTEVMFKPGGYTYIYLIYGMYYCFNVVTGREDKPEAVLIRSVEPVSGLEMIKKNRDIKSKQKEDLTNGPGKLCQALKIDNDLNRLDLVNQDVIYIENQPAEKDFEVAAGKRINIDYAEEYKNKLWRFYMKDNSFLSN